MIQDMLKSSDGNNYQEREMSEENRNRKQVQISLSENQLAAIDKAAAENGMNRSEFIRHTFAQVIENFPNDLQAHGAALNKSREL